MSKPLDHSVARIQSYNYHRFCLDENNRLGPVSAIFGHFYWSSILTQLKVPLSRAIWTILVQFSPI